VSEGAGGFSLTASRNFPAWLSESRVSIAITTYQTNKLILIGLNEAGAVSVFERTLERPMAMHIEGDDLYVATAFQIWRFGARAPFGPYQGFDRVYAPLASIVTGDLDIHDIARDAGGRLVFVNTLYSCIAATAARANFEPVWRPPFVSRLAPEDRCHLNGVALKDGAIGFATAAGRSDVADGWRDRRADGGVVIDIAANHIIAEGLSMPHSPRWRDGTLYVCSAGSGEFGRIDPASGRFEPIAFLPGFIRGLTFSGRYAMVSLSPPREKTFRGLPLEGRLAAAGAEPRAGIAVIDLETGDAPHWLRLDGVGELYDVAVLPGVRRPAAIGFKSDEVRRAVLIG
jgi:uncharacterized protein (TIGR03032 family)